MCIYCMKYYGISSYTVRNWREESLSFYQQEIVCAQSFGDIVELLHVYSTCKRACNNYYFIYVFTPSVTHPLYIMMFTNACVSWNSHLYTCIICIVYASHLGRNNTHADRIISRQVIRQEVSHDTYIFVL